MSKAFTKEDDETPERVGRKRSSSGLPPGAVNYLTARGADLFRGELADLRQRTKTGKHDDKTLDRITQLKELLETATIVPTRAEAPDEVLFGTSVIVQTAGGATTLYRIVGIDEASPSPVG